MKRTIVTDLRLDRNRLYLTDQIFRSQAGAGTGSARVRVKIDNQRPQLRQHVGLAHFDSHGLKQL